AVARGAQRPRRRGEEPPPAFAPRAAALSPAKTSRVFAGAAWHDSPLYARETLRPGDRIAGPAVIAEQNATTVVEPGWQATLSPRGHLVLEPGGPIKREDAIGTDADPVRP